MTLLACYDRKIFRRFYFTITYVIPIIFKHRYVNPRQAVFYAYEKINILLIRESLPPLSRDTILGSKKRELMIMCVETVKKDYQQDVSNFVDHSTSMAITDW